MSIKAYTFVLIVSSLFLVVSRDASPLQAQTITTTKMPLSFYSLGDNQSIRFSVSTANPAACFDIEVTTQPQPQAKIRLCISASMQIQKAEQVWGHHAGKQIIRSLTADDVRTLENFLAAHRATGALSKPSSTAPAMEFDLITKRMAKEGFMRPDIDKKEFYNPSEAADQDFIKHFIGFSD